MSSHGPGPRDYSSATDRALYAFSKATCYYPECLEPVIKFIGEDPVTNVDRAHIHGAKPGSARYEAAMSDDERRAFSNLILLCTPHHRLVDQLRPDEFPAETLLKWKAERETDAGIDRKLLSAITEDDLFALIERAVGSAGAPKREALVEIEMGFAGSKVFLLKTETAKEFIDLDDYKDFGPQALILTLRNSGSLPITWEGASVEFVPRGGGVMAESGAWFRNPLLPLRIESGDSARWFFSLPLLTRMVAFFRQQGQQVEALVGKARLASGETVESRPLSTDYLPDLHR